MSGHIESYIPGLESARYCHLDEFCGIKSSGKAQIYAPDHKGPVTLDDLERKPGSLT